MELLPEIWERCFQDMHPCNLIIVAGVCKAWRRLARGVIACLFLEKGLLTTVPYSEEIFMHGEVPFGYRSRTYSYVLEIEIFKMPHKRFFGYTLKKIENSYDYKWHRALVIELPRCTYGLCRCCGCHVLRTTGISFGAGRFFFCSPKCHETALEQVNHQ